MNVNDIANQAAQENDFTQTTEGGGDFPIIAEGLTKCRLIDYIEYGDHMHGSDPHRKRRPMARFTVECYGEKNMIEVDGVMKPLVQSFKVPISNNESSDYIKIFNGLNYHQRMTHPAQALGQAYLVKVTHNKSKDEKTTYVNFWDGTPKAKNWTFQAPVREGFDGEPPTRVSVPDQVNGSKIFIWANPLKECWDALFIDGTKKKKVDGKEVEVSKNWLQNLMKDALNFKGSKLEAMLSGEATVAIDGLKS